MVERHRSVTSLDLMLDLEASELRFAEQRRELQSLRRLHSVVRSQGAETAELREWLRENEAVMQRLSRRQRGSDEVSARSFSKFSRKFLFCSK